MAPPHQSCLSSLATVALQPVMGGFSAAKNFIQLFIHSGGVWLFRALQQFVIF